MDADPCYLYRSIWHYIFSVGPTAYRRERHAIVGDEVTQELKVKRQQNDRQTKRGVVMTSGGNSKFRKILHVTLDSRLGKLRDAMGVALTLADKEGLRSVAVPPIRNDVYGRRELHKAIYDVCVQFETEKQPRALHFIIVHTHFRTERSDGFIDMACHACDDFYF